jgi:hypothetical protein
VIANVRQLRNAVTGQNLLHEMPKAVDLQDLPEIPKAVDLRDHLHTVVMAIAQAPLLVENKVNAHLIHQKVVMAIDHRDLLAEKENKAIWLMKSTC